jgi:hypothetical protein
MRMKIGLDAARDALRLEREQSSRIARVLAETVALLNEQQRLASKSDEIADGYSEALTQLLAPNDPRGI